MTGQQMALLDALFEQACAVPEPERPAWLVAHCDDPEVRAELESLLPHAAAVRGFTAVVSSAAELSRHSPLAAGQTIGPYRIVGILGEGGMGTVYEGVRDDEFHQTVAIKLLRMSARSGTERHRFLRERQILAELDHPHIARLFDGGTADDGSPYIVMERIEGEPVTDFANSRKLTIRQRLELFRRVANAVQYAHQKLIVHRDLKPGNILVSSGPGGEPLPKLLDFGIAKLLDNETGGAEALTATGSHLMTPDYASPEQVQGKPVTVASDVYSLGAVLYELLTGVRPHGLKSYDPSEITERICSQDVAPPSSVAEGAARAALRGDLDTIVLKAMQKVPQRRYNSAEQFSEDIRRYLHGLPVLARPDTAGYRLRKFAGRHWVGLGAAAAVMMALGAGAAVSMYQAHLARNQARLAQERFELVRTLANRFLFDFHAEIEQISGTTKAQQMVVNTAVEYLDKLSQTAGSDRALLKEMAEAYARLAKVQGAAGVSNAGRHEEALASQRRSVEFYRRLAAVDPANRLSLARSLLDEAHLEENLLQKNENLQHSREAVQILDGLVAANPQDVKLIGECGMAYKRLSSAMRASGELDQALAATLKAQEYFRATFGAGDDLQAKYRLAIAQQDEGEVRIASGDVEEATSALESALRTIEEIAAAAPANRYYQYLRIQHLELLEEAYYSIEDMSSGDSRKAVQLDRTIRNLARDLLASDAADNAARINMAMVQIEGVLPLSEIDPRQAAEYGQSVMKLFDQALQSTAGDQFSASRKARAEMMLALAQLRAGQMQEALAASQEAANTYRGLMARKSDGDRFQRMSIFVLATSGDVLAAAKRDSEARRVFEEAAALGEQLRAKERPPLSHTIAAAYAFDHFGEYWKTRGDASQARQWFERSYQAWAARAEPTPAVKKSRRQAKERLNGLDP